MLLQAKHSSPIFLLEMMKIKLQQNKKEEWQKLKKGIVMFEE
jgi:hypothetical protein